tara:strand:- start:217 stop:318 length:102 start_codon:yes stop_codon:yes gene_type:complete
MIHIYFLSFVLLLLVELSEPALVVAIIVLKPIA